MKNSDKIHIFLCLLEVPRNGKSGTVAVVKKVGSGLVAGEYFFPDLGECSENCVMVAW